MSTPSQKISGIQAALASSFFLGMAPVFGKMAILAGLSPFFVVATRTVLAAFLLLLVVFVFHRQFLYIYPAGLLGCILAGWINGVGSLLYYSALGRINASLGQIIYSMYPLFVALWLWLDHQHPSRLTLVRMILVPPALVLLAQGQQIDKIGILMMLGSSILYALHLPINQRVLFDMPAPTVTLYTLISMSAAVLPVYFFIGIPGPQMGNALPAFGGLLGLTAVTFFSRLTLFTGVKQLGGLQTSLLGLAELVITLFFSWLLLRETFTIIQWMGVGLLIVNLVLVFFEKEQPRRTAPGGWLSWLAPGGLARDIPWQPHE